MTEVLKSFLLQIAIKALSALIPALGGLFGTPILGAMAAWAVSWLTDLLAKAIALWAKKRQINKDAMVDLDNVTAKKLALDNATGADREKALKDFADAASKFGRLRV
jgi:hypothetical protein